MTTTDSSLTVERALKELRGMDSNAYWRVVVTGYATPGGEIKQDVDVVHTALVTLEQRIFRAQAISEAMAQVRKWKQEQQ